MRSFAILCLIAIVAALPQSQAAPVPKRTSARPAVIKAGNQQHIQWVQERLVSYAHIAILQDKKVADLAIVRRHLQDPKDTKELIAWLEKNFRIERVKGKNLVRVSFQEGNAKEQGAIINAVVDYFLKNNVGSTRDHLTKVLRTMKASVEAERRAGNLTAEEAAKAEESFKKREEYIETLPALVEAAKVP